MTAEELSLRANVELDIAKLFLKLMEAYTELKNEAEEEMSIQDAELAIRLQF